MAYEADLGQLEALPDGRFALTFERLLPQPPRTVWLALTDLKHLRTWFVQVLDYDRSRLQFAPGAVLEFVSTDAAAPTAQGHVTHFEPHRLLEYTWDEEILRWQLEPHGERGCRLRFTNIIADLDTARAVAPGWHAGLDALGAVLDGRAVADPAWAELTERYANSFG